MATIRLNGTHRTISDGLTVAALLAELGLGHEGIAVAVDRQVVARREHASHVLQDGSHVEVIRAVGGG
jgi:sulfur carrier protein